ncbi:hypothetical protein [Jatrophihabitans sp.]|jgi:hypothetical protein|uniref:hypothetical protein n=1 Tax=Jatrophihabitans sp. TaxID=1932789 RepID=UPI002F04C72E
MTGHGRRFKWSGRELGEQPHSEGKHRRDEHLPESASGALAIDALSLAAAVVSAYLAIRFDLAFRRSSGSAVAVRYALTGGWAVGAAFAVWHRLRARRAILADPWGYLARAARARAAAMRRRGRLPGFPAGRSGTAESAAGASILEAFTKRRAAATDQQPPRSRIVYGDRSALNLGRYLVVTVITIGLCTTFFFDSSIDPTNLAWSIVGVGFAFIMFLGALAFWQRHTRDAPAAAGRGAERLAADSATGSSAPISLSKPERPSEPESPSEPISPSKPESLS